MKRREFITLGGGGDDVAARRTRAATNGRGSTACGKRGRHQGVADIRAFVQLEQRACGRYGLVRLSRSLEFGDLKLPGGLQAATNPPGSISVLAQEHFGLDAIHVGFVVEVVSARCRERSSCLSAPRLATPNPRVFAVWKA